MYLKKYFGWRCNRSDDDIRTKLWLSHYYALLCKHEPRSVNGSGKTEILFGLKSG